MNDKLKAAIETCNRILETNEPRSTEKDPHSNRSGYKVGWVILALNSGFGPGNWRLEEVSAKISSFEFQAQDRDGSWRTQVRQEAIYRGNFFVRLPDGEWFSTGTATGSNLLIRGQGGDAIKAARSDCLKKAASELSIGKRAFLGLLGTNVMKAQRTGGNGNGRQAAPAAEPAASAPPDEPPAPQGDMDFGPEPESAPRSNDLAEPANESPAKAQNRAAKTAVLEAARAMIDRWCAATDETESAALAFGWGAKRWEALPVMRAGAIRVGVAKLDEDLKALRSGEA